MGADFFVWLLKGHSCPFLESKCVESLIPGVGLDSFSSGVVPQLVLSQAAHTPGASSRAESGVVCPINKFTGAVRCALGGEFRAQHPTAYSLLTRVFQLRGVLFWFPLAALSLQTMEAPDMCCGVGILFRLGFLGNQKEHPFLEAPRVQAVQARFSGGAEDTDLADTWPLAQLTRGQCSETSKREWLQGACVFFGRLMRWLVDGWVGGWVGCLLDWPFGPFSLLPQFDRGGCVVT